jgi:putative membrane protein
MTDGFARRHVRSLAAVLSLLSVGVVVAAVRGAIPASALPRASDSFLHAIPTLNAAISVLAIATISAGWRFIRRGDVKKHQAAMGTSTLLFATFLALYLYRVVLAGTTQFPGPDAVYTFVYLPVLAIHIGLAIVCIPLVYYALLLAGTREVSEIPATPHARVGRAAASLWLVSFALGIVVYLLLYVVY